MDIAEVVYTIMTWIIVGLLALLITGALQLVVFITVKSATLGYLRAIESFKKGKCNEASK